MTVTQRVRQRLQRNPATPVPELTVDQAGSALTVDFSTSAGLRAIAVWFYLPTFDAWHRIADLDPDADRHRIEVSLADLAVAAPDPPGGTFGYLQIEQAPRSDGPIRPER